MCFDFLKSKPKPEPIPIPIPIVILPVVSKVIARQEFLDKIGLPAYNPDKPLDGTVALVSKSELDRIVGDLIYPADDYIAETADCEDYALRAQVDASFKFKVGSIRLCLGNSPLGYHGFVIALDDMYQRWLLEPNAGFEFSGRWLLIGENGYIPDCVFV